MNELKPLIERIREFNEDLDWRQFHNSKDMALSLMLSAAGVIDILPAPQDKMDKNETKYPVEKARGSNKKWSDL